MVYPVKGIFICGGDITAIRVHVPTEQKGQFRIIDQQVDYGIFDFNIAYVEKGFWLFKRKFLPVQDTPIIDIPSGSNPPITVGVFTEKTGKQFAVIDSFKMAGNSNSFTVEYTCSGRKLRVGDKTDWSYGQNVGGCLALVDSTIALNISHDITPTRISLAGCGYDKTVNSLNVKSTQIILTVKPDICPLYIQVENKLYLQRAKLMILGKPRSELNIDKAVILENKVFKPIGSSILTGEYYVKGKISKRFVTDSDSQDVSWFTEGNLCLFAHSTLGMSSEVCYNYDRQELPMAFFR